MIGTHRRSFKDLDGVRGRRCNRLAPPRIERTAKPYTWAKGPRWHARQFIIRWVSMLRFLRSPLLASLALVTLAPVLPVQAQTAPRPVQTADDPWLYKGSD